MVAYGFKKFFAPQILDGSKTHTIRGHRRRHAHVGESVQLFTGMRTRHCVKIIADPVCVAVLPIVIMSSDLLSAGIAYIGLAPASLIGETARETMGRFWRSENPGSRFEGVIIRWRP